MSAGIATVGRRVYAVGLYWENSPSGRVMQAAKEAARQPGQQADFYALRAGTKDGRVPQFGLGQKAAGHKDGMPVFAACLAAQQPGSWAGAFRLREGTVVTVIRDDLILPDGDQIYLNENEARERLLQEIGFGGLQRIYAPEAWSISGADSMPISLLLDERRDVRLRAVEIPKQTIIAAAAIVGVLALIFAIGFYLQSSQKAEPITVANVVPTIIEPPKPVYPPPERRWEKAPSALAVINTCRQALTQIPAVIYGWRLNPLKCNGNSVSLSWNREKGFSTPPKGATVADTGNAATMEMPLTPPPPRGSEELFDIKEITRRYLAQDWPGALNRAPDDPPPPPPPGYNGQWQPPPAPWVKRSFTLTVPELPGSLPVFLGDLPGVVISAANFSPSNGASGGSWSIEGVIYENRNESHE